MLLAFVSSALPVPAFSVDTASLAERMLAQEGFAIALASTVMQAQLQVAQMGLNANGNVAYPCAVLDGGGSVNGNVNIPSTGNAVASVTIYYDSACSTPYVRTMSNMQIKDWVATINETATYLGVDGSQHGTLNLTEAISFATTNLIQIYGIGLFTPSNGAPATQLGLTCSISFSDSGSASTLPCQGGVAQNLASLGVAIGSVTPITLSPLSGSTTNGVVFSGSGSTLVSGPLNSLKLIAPSTETLAVQGGANFGTSASKGSVATFALFPPTPTSWSVIDEAHGLQFNISVVDNVRRNLSATISEIATGNNLATATLDQSGTGNIRFSDGSTTPIINWVLADNGQLILNQTISFSAAPTVIVGGTGTISATGGASGNPVTFTSTTTGVCTVSGSVVTGVTAGTCAIAANQAGNTNYSAAAQSILTFIVSQDSQMNPAADCLFNWAESNYPSLFSPAGSATQLSGIYTYRYYSATNSYLGVSSADSNVYYLGPNGGTPQDEGSTLYWLPLAGCQ